MAKLPGSTWISGTNLHFVDENGIEKYYTGTLAGAVSGNPGSVWIENDSLCYVDAASNKRTIGGQYDVNGVSAVIGSIWIEGGLLRTVVASGGTSKFRHHGDTTHNDIIHIDTGHNDHGDAGSAHQDNPAGYTDSHGDSHTDVAPPHNDVWTPVYCDGHYDVPSGAVHIDQFFPCSGGVGVSAHGDFTPFDQHGDATVSFQMNTYGDHSDGVHTDSHGDAHADQGSPHIDHTDHADHSDFSHSDVPHNDLPHSDSPVTVGA